jgi:tetratricopeptide (TPR) repeat protein
MNDVDACTAAYNERLALAEADGDTLLRADAHYDVGFLSVIANEPEGLLEHEAQALKLYEEVGNQTGALLARQALGLATFLVGDYARARDIELVNQEEFRQKSSPYQVADSQTFLAAVHYRLGDAEAAWQSMLQALDFFAEHDNASGIVRGLGMAAIILLEFGDAELGARVTGLTYELVRQKGVMVAPVVVLHLRDPRELAVERLGAERAQALMDDGAMISLDEVLRMVVAAGAPASTPAPIAG